MIIIIRRHTYDAISKEADVTQEGPRGTAGAAGAEATGPADHSRVPSRSRRTAFALAAASAGSAAVLAPLRAQAQGGPEIRWRCASSYPKSLDTIFGAGETFARYVAAATDNRFRITVHPAGELVPPLQVLDAVQNASVDLGFTVGQFNWGKEPTWALATGGPFALNARLQNAWMYHGGGIELFEPFFAANRIYALPCGNTGAQMGGWFRREIRSVDDLKGLKMRVAGLGGVVMARLGVVPQQIAAGDIYTSLERGTIDAAEWVGPYDDEKLGFVKVAPHYYYPGFWEGGAMQHIMINLEKWNALPDSYKGVIRAAAQATNCDMQARYDALNPLALRKLVGSGAKLHAFSREIMQAAFDASAAMYAEFSEKSATFKKVYDAMTAFRREGYLWFQVAEGTYDTFLMQQQRANRL